MSVIRQPRRLRPTLGYVLVLGLALVVGLATGLIVAGGTP